MITATEKPTLLLDRRRMRRNIERMADKAGSKEEIKQRYHSSVQAMQRINEALEAAGLSKARISVGDTPGCSLVDDLSGVDEIRPGNFVFYDAMQWRLGSCAEEDIAVAVACPVVSRHPDRNELVVYGGAVHLSLSHLQDGHGAPVYGFLVSVRRMTAGDRS